MKICKILLFSIPLVLFAETEKTGIPLEKHIPLPASVLAFPPFDRSYQTKIEPESGYYEIFTEGYLRYEAFSQKKELIPDNPIGGWAYHRAARVYAPGLSFVLKAPVDTQSRFGWKLVIDFAIGRQNSMLQNFRICIQDLGCHFFTNKEIENKNPIIFEIPFIRDAEGKVQVRIEIPNHYYSTFALYDAFLSREKSLISKTNHN